MSYYGNQSDNSNNDNNKNLYPPVLRGEAASYYQQQPQGQYPPPQQHQQYLPQGQQYQAPGQHHSQGQQYPGPGLQGSQQDSFDGERGALGALGGGVAGGFGGHAVGGAGGHSKLGTAFGVLAGAIAGHKLQDGVEDWKDGRDEKKEEEKRKEEERRREEERRMEKENRMHEKPQHSSPGVHYAGGFSGSARDIRLDSGGEYMLRASCRRVDGSYQASSISLNKILENDQGSFRWASQNRKREPSPQRGCARQVTVQPGDTLRGIAAQVGCSFDELARANGIQNPDLIYPGQVLNVPGASRGGDVGNFGASARNVRLVDDGRRLEGELLRNGQWVGSSIVLDERIRNDNGTLTYKY
ncbi:CVNH domain-containing protein [Schizothecium vesticola]|uniref:CVNH domain-containing protein n=1 Tax=Schizothecium vesticola TaxID=314040 RepID=A0AA40F0K4_9PEZI|nr:CVNH domain-containing protein [Schizothecium vesticola]